MLDEMVAHKPKKTKARAGKDIEDMEDLEEHSNDTGSEGMKGKVAGRRNVEAQAVHVQNSVVREGLVLRCHSSRC